MWRVLVERSEQPQGTAPPYFHPVMQLLSNRRAVFYKQSVTLNVWNKPIAASSVFCIRMMAIYCKSVHIMLQELMKKQPYAIYLRCSAVQCLTAYFIATVWTNNHQVRWSWARCSIVNYCCDVWSEILGHSHETEHRWVPGDICCSTK